MNQTIRIIGREVKKQQEEKKVYVLSEYSESKQRILGVFSKEQEAKNSLKGILTSITVFNDGIEIDYKGETNVIVRNIRTGELINQTKITEHTVL